MKDTYTKTVGSYLIVHVYDSDRKMIAEITMENPLQIKIGETSEFENIGDNDFEILTQETLEFQNDATRDGLLLRHYNAGEAIVGGLRSLNILDGNFYKILPVVKN